MQLHRLVASRALQLVLTVFFVVTLTFYTSHIVPGDPARALAGPYASESVVQNMVKLYGLDKPIYVQYYIYVTDLLRGNLGISSESGRPVVDDIAQFLPATIELVVTATIIGVAIGTFLGVIAATRRSRPSGIASSILALLGYSLPVFWIGLIFQIVFGYQLHILPIAGRLDPTISLTHVTGIDVIDSMLTGNWLAFENSLSHLILPAFVLSFATLGIIAKFVRSTMLDVLGQEYVRTARAYGFPERVVEYKYALKNTLIPVITHVGLDFGALFGYTVVAEAIFQYPGMGLYLSNSILSLDFNAISGSAIVLATVVVLTNFVVDIIYGIVDPRIRYGTRDNG